MKRLCKWLLGIGGFLALAGALLALQGRLMGGETRVTVDWFGRQLTVEPLGAYAGNRPSGTPDSGDTTPRVLVEETLEPLREIRVDVDLAEVSILPSDTWNTVDAGETAGTADGPWGLVLEYGGDTRQLAWSCEGGVLEVWDEGDAGLDLFGTSGSASVTVYVPRGAGLEYVDVQADVGGCTLEGFQAQELTLTADLGDASLTDLALGTADLTLDMGSLTLDAVEAEKLTAELDMGDLTGTLSTTEALTATCDMGSISLEGSFRGTTDLTADMGAVELFSALPRGEYRYDLSADMGTVTVDGAGRGQSVQAGDGANELTVRCGMGDAAVAFGPAANTGDTAVESGDVASAGLELAPADSPW